MHPQWLTHWHPASWGYENKCLFTARVRTCLPSGSSWNKVIEHGCVIICTCTTHSAWVSFYRTLEYILLHYMSTWFIHPISIHLRVIHKAWQKGGRRARSFESRPRDGCLREYWGHQQSPAHFLFLCIKWFVQGHCVVTDDLHVPDKSCYVSSRTGSVALVRESDISAVECNKIWCRISCSPEDER